MLQQTNEQSKDLRKKIWNGSHGG